LVTLYAIFQIQFFDLHHWKEDLKTIKWSGSTSLNNDWLTVFDHPVRNLSDIIFFSTPLERGGQEG